MRVFLVLLLFMLLPLQSPAAVSVACCGHQAAPGSQPAHHQPDRGLAVAGEEGHDFGSRFDLDCGTCHAGCAAAVFTISATFSDPSGSQRIEHREATRMSPWHARPYRPQWRTPIRSGFDAAA